MTQIKTGTDTEQLRQYARDYDSKHHLLSVALLWAAQQIDADNVAIEALVSDSRVDVRAIEMQLDDTKRELKRTQEMLHEHAKELRDAKDTIADLDRQADERLHVDHPEEKFMNELTSLVGAALRTARGEIEDPDHPWTFDYQGLSDELVAIADYIDLIETGMDANASVSATRRKAVMTFAERLNKIDALHVEGDEGVCAECHQNFPCATKKWSS